MEKDFLVGSSAGPFSVGLDQFYFYVESCRCLENWRLGGRVWFGGRRWGYFQDSSHRSDSLGWRHKNVPSLDRLVGVWAVVVGAFMSLHLERSMCAVDEVRGALVIFACQTW